MMAAVSVVIPARVSCLPDNLKTTIRIDVKAMYFSLFRQIQQMVHFWQNEAVPGNKFQTCGNHVCVGNKEATSIKSASSSITLCIILGMQLKGGKAYFNQVFHFN